MQITKKEAHNIWETWKKLNKITYNELRKRCNICRSEQKLSIDHIDGNKANNTLNNLQCLCIYCHFKKHHTEFVVIYKSGFSECEKQEKLIIEEMTDIQRQNEIIKIRAYVDNFFNRRMHLNYWD